MRAKLYKLFVALCHPLCWRPLTYGVAPSAEHVDVLRSISVDGVIDVGANRGQFSLACSIALPEVPIVAFEPIPNEAITFRRVHPRSPSVELIQTAVGSSSGIATLHLSKRADSSSVLPIGKNQTAIFRETDEVGTIEVPMIRLDDARGHWAGRKHQLLKIDVQGYELEVLKGSTSTLLSCSFVYAECSDVALYDGQALRPEVVSFLDQNGFTVRGLYNPYFVAGLLIQADYLFERRTPIAASPGLHGTL